MQKLPRSGKTKCQRSTVRAACCASMHFWWSCKKVSSAMLTASSLTRTFFFWETLFFCDAFGGTDDLFVMSFSALRLFSPVAPFLATDCLELFEFSLATASFSPIAAFFTTDCLELFDLSPVTASIKTKIENEMKLLS
nr:hypothetical protein Itr_chr09CG03150 [Ipomoea trifida]